MVLFLFTVLVFEVVSLYHVFSSALVAISSRKVSNHLRYVLQYGSKLPCSFDCEGGLTLFDFYDNQFTDNRLDVRHENRHLPCGSMYPNRRSDDEIPSAQQPNVQLSVLLMQRLMHCHKR